MNREPTVQELDFYAKLQESWQEGFDDACMYYDRTINEMHRALHPDQSLSYTKCFESPCKDL
jgi:hypothetical protein